MATFKYQAISTAGTVVVGNMEAGSRAEVVDQLDRAGFTPITTRETTPKPARSWRNWLIPDPNSEDITGFTLDLAMLLKGGIVLDEALLILTQMETKHWLQRLVRVLRVELSGGKSFSQALAAHPHLFTPIYVKTIEVAEAAGRLDEALTSIARERQRSEQLRKRFVAAISYPLFLAIAAIGVLCFVLLYIIPQFEVVIQGFSDRIDSSALLVFAISRGFRENLGLVVTGAIAMLATLIILKRLGKVRSIWIAVLMRLPITRVIPTHDLTLTFCRTLAVLVENDVDISTALRLIRGVVRLPTVADEIDHVTADVRQGQRLSEALRRRTFLPGHVVQMLRVGEEAGSLANTATHIASFYEAKLDAALGRLIAVIGPVLMIGVSLLIAWLIISVMTALISINDLLR